MWQQYDHVVMAAIAIAGTAFGAAAFLWVAHRSRHATLVARWRGLSPPFVNVVGVLFALTLAFIANDTWLAHDRAIMAVQQEAGALRSLSMLAEGAAPDTREAVIAAVHTYVRRVTAEEWPLMAQRRHSADADAHLDRLLAVLARDTRSAAALQARLLDEALKVRSTRDTRLALSRAHVNPLKWVGMALLGYLSLIAIAMVYIDQPRAEIAAVVLFSLAAGPTAAIVLVQANPFQGPAAVLAAPIAGLLP